MSAAELANKAEAKAIAHAPRRLTNAPITPPPE
jgi:hypothetical protein